MTEIDEKESFWLVNVPAGLPAECPEFLKNIAEGDKRILSIRDSEFKRKSWYELNEIILANKLELLHRVPSDLRRYLAFCWKIKQEYGSITNFLISERLHWSKSLKPSGDIPFTNENDIKILCNDWPYGIDQKIVHLIVWTKFKMEEQPGSGGDLSDKSRELIKEYVYRKFSSVPSEHVLWFRNWASLKSVHSVEHFHIFLYDPDPEFIREITNDDTPLYKVFKNDSLGDVKELTADNAEKEKTMFMSFVHWILSILPYVIALLLFLKYCGYLLSEAIKEEAMSDD